MASGQIALGRDDMMWRKELEVTGNGSEFGTLVKRNA
jgi:hypothetical protein